MNRKAAAVLEKENEQLVWSVGERLEKKIEHAKAIQLLAKSVGPMKKGDVVFFWGDTYHYGPRLSQSSYRQMLFVPLTVHGEYDANKQLHPITLGELLYGKHSDEQLELMFAFWMAIEAPTVEMAHSEIMSLSGEFFSEFNDNTRRRLRTMEAIHKTYLVKRKMKFGF